MADDTNEIVSIVSLSNNGNEDDKSIDVYSFIKKYIQNQNITYE